MKIGVGAETKYRGNHFMKGAKWRALFCFIVALAAGCFAAACAEEHVHEYEAVVTPPTCTEQGYTTYTCPEDGESYVGDYVEPLGHTPAEAVKENVVDATCLGGGSYDLIIYCSVCGEELSRESVDVEKKDHTPETVPGKEATCTQAGLTEGSKCSVCGTVLKEQEEIPAKGHTPSEAKKENEKTATCTEAGSYDEVVYCSVCKEEISRKHVQTAALGHAWGSGAVTTAPTCSATGVRTYTCSRCDAKRTENIPMTAHTPVTVPGKAATCFAPGLTEGSKCSVCGEVITEQQKIEALSHTFNGNAVCSVCGAIDMSRPEKGSGSTVAVHDPSVIIAYVDNYGIVYPTKEDGRGLTKVYFVFGTQLAAAYSFDMESWVAFTPTFYAEGTATVSADYYKVFRTVADWSGYKDSATVLGNTWAPDIIYNPELEKWCVYYSLSGDGNGHKQSSVYLMTSSSITGPYVYAGSVVYSGMTNETSGAGNADYQKVTRNERRGQRRLSKSDERGHHCRSLSDERRVEQQLRRPLHRSCRHV